MKVQSDLTGDRERAAEMTAPCESRVTTWMDRITKLTKATLSNAHTISEAVESCNPTNFAIPELPRITISSEVSYRPAGQQWPVCTP